MLSEDEKLYCPKCLTHPEQVCKNSYHCIDCSQGDFEDLLNGCKDCGETCPSIEEKGDRCEGCKDVLHDRVYG